MGSEPAVVIVSSVFWLAFAAYFGAEVIRGRAFRGRRRSRSTSLSLALIFVAIASNSLAADLREGSPAASIAVTVVMAALFAVAVGIFVWQGWSGKGTPVAGGRHVNADGRS